MLLKKADTTLDDAILESAKRSERIDIASGPLPLNQSCFFRRPKTFFNSIDPFRTFQDRLLCRDSDRLNCIVMSAPLTLKVSHAQLKRRQSRVTTRSNNADEVAVFGREPGQQRVYAGGVAAVSGESVRYDNKASGELAWLR